ncbi:ATP-binding cassette domain-containing protein [Epidermidibacterium keratini]|uniref:ABC-type quaternary amine transporter n=2 Tax=Epidermidibacterium keratini TaxID=1891644 RepID=A0A7L4YPK5_9ACTN|nr:ABC transporter ATP-binding protein [Epidermidibacterium keratini]QHC00814.1 ATP-binding cassette domain-containing protein [Epidermidibacterium keratini]
MVDLHVEELTVAYGRSRILDRVSLHVPSATTTAILGPSGCGKTTLLRAIAGFIRPDGGSVRLGERDVAGPRAWVAPERRQIGYVSQDGNLFPHLSVGANVTFGLPRRQRRAGTRVPELLELVGLDPSLATRSPARLSGGQQQRVALARALARDPEVVLLDEPFSSLDVALRASTRQAVADALRASGSTVVLVTHDQSEALSFASQVAVMSAGVFSHVGGPADVYQRPADLATATFVGDGVVLDGVLNGPRVTTALGALEHDGAVADGPVSVLIRPEQVILSASGVGGVVEQVSFLGADMLVVVRLPDDIVVRARVAGTEVVAVGDAVRLQVTGRARIFAPD